MKKYNYMVEYINKNNMCKVVFVNAGGVVSAFNTSNKNNIYDISDISGLNQDEIKTYIKELALYNQKQLITQ